MGFEQRHKHNNIYNCRKCGENYQIDVKMTNSEHIHRKKSTKDCPLCTEGIRPESRECNFTPKKYPATLIPRWYRKQCIEQITGKDMTDESFKNFRSWLDDSSMQASVDKLVRQYAKAYGFKLNEQRGSNFNI